MDKSSPPWGISRRCSIWNQESSVPKQSSAQLCCYLTAFLSLNFSIYPQPSKFKSYSNYVFPFTLTLAFQLLTYSLCQHYYCSIKCFTHHHVLRNHICSVTSALFIFLRRNFSTLTTEKNINHKIYLMHLISGYGNS